jgi:hypothetical protein
VGYLRVEDFDVSERAMQVSGELRRKRAMRVCEVTTGQHDLLSHIRKVRLRDWQRKNMGRKGAGDEQIGRKSLEGDRRPRNVNAYPASARQPARRYEQVLTVGSVHGCS